MNFLLVDVGNTKTKFKFTGQLQSPNKIHSLVNSQITIAALEQLSHCCDFDRVVISSVGNVAIQNIVKDFADKKGCGVTVAVTHHSMMGLRFIYKDIVRLGVDRALAMIAAYQREAVLVIDAGSALTADFVNKDGMHLGGYILPGVGMSKAALLGNTVKIKAGEIYTGIRLGTDTDTCVNNGNAFMYKQLILGLVDEAKRLDIERIVFTGGDGLMLLNISGVAGEYKENMVLEGLEMCVNELMNEQAGLGERI